MPSKKILHEFAKLAVEIGVNVKKGQMLVINGPVEAYEFIEECVAVAYEKGSSRVIVNYSDEKLTRLNFENVKTDVLKEVPQWSKDRYQYYIDKGACMLHVISDDPEVLKGIDKKKVKTVRLEQMKANQPFQYYTTNNIGQWSIVAYPNVKWAKKVFPDKSDEEAVDALWKAILKTSRVENGKTVENWKKHNQQIKKHTKKLNELHFDALHFASKSGTDLTVGLTDKHIWCGGDAVSANKQHFQPNIPTEEVFTMPDRYHIDGKVVASKPLAYNGNVIEDFWLMFKDGRVTDFGAKKNQDVLKAILDTDEGAKSLGEVALISYDSPISRSKILFYETLFDENASCHLALGSCYPETYEGGVELEEDELYKLGGNKSMTHIDFMFGTKDMEITGIKKDGKEVSVFKKGNFVI